VITNNLNTNIHFLNSRDFSKRVSYMGTEVVQSLRDLGTNNERIGYHRFVSQDSRMFMV